MVVGGIIRGGGLGVRGVKVVRVEAVDVGVVRTVVAVARVKAVGGNIKAEGITVVAGIVRVLGVISILEAGRVLVERRIVIIVRIASGVRTQGIAVIEV
jgi:hypothetical protein